MNGLQANPLSAINKKNEVILVFEMLPIKFHVPLYKH